MLYQIENPRKKQEPYQEAEAHLHQPRKQDGLAREVDASYMYRAPETACRDC